MKKLLLIAATLCLAVACNDSKPGGNGDDPKPPVPTGDPAVNRVDIKGKKAILDTAHIIVSNFELGKAKYKLSDQNFAFTFDVKADQNLIVLTSMTQGEVILTLICDEKQFPIECSFDYSVPTQMFNEPIMMPWGKTVDEVKAMSEARGDVLTEERLSKDKTYYVVSYQSSNPFEIAQKEVYDYIFPTSGLDYTPGLCEQVSQNIFYGTSKTEDQNKCFAARNYITERYYYAGQPWISEGDESHAAISRDLKYHVQYSAVIFEGGIYGLWTGYMEAPKEESAPSRAYSVSVPSYLNGFDSKPMVNIHSAEQLVAVK